MSLALLEARPAYPGTVTEEAGQSSRDRMLDAAERLFARYGYSATSVAQICKESGLPNGSLYYHFGGKANVVVALLDRGTSGFTTGLGPVADSTSVEDWMGGAADAVLARLPFFRVVLHLVLEDVDDAAVRELLLRLRGQTEALVSGYLSAHARRCGVRDPDPLVDQLTALTIAVTRGSIASERFDPQTFRTVMRQHGAAIAMLVEHAVAPAQRVG